MLRGPLDFPKLVCLIAFGFRMCFLYGSFLLPLPSCVNSATLKRAAQTPSGTPDLLCHPVRERTNYTSRPPTCGFEGAAPCGYYHLLLRPSPIATGLLRVHAEDKPVREILQWESRCTGAITLSQPQKPGSSGMKNRHDWGLPWLQCMATTSVVPCRALCAPRRLLFPPL